MKVIGFGKLRKMFAHSFLIDLKGNKMKFIHGQILNAALQAIYRHAEVISGAYRFRELQCGVDSKDIEKYHANGLLVEPVLNGRAWRHMTDDEKLQDTLGIMKRQIDFVRECVDHIGNNED